MNRQFQPRSVAVILGLLLATTLVGTPAFADDLSASLSGGGQGVASIQTLNASNLSFALFADVGNITSAEILQGSSVFLSLGSNFGGGIATGSASGNVAAIADNPSAYSVRVQGTGGTATGDLAFAAESGDGGPGPGDGRVDTGNTDPCGQGGGACALDSQYDVTVALANQQGQVVDGNCTEYTNDTVLCYVFEETNIELIVKVLDTCGLFGTVDKRWIFAGGATDLAGSISIREVSTGLARVYEFPEQPFVAINDTQEAQPCPEA